MLTNVTEVAAVWEDFLFKKFSITPAEQQRDPMEQLPVTSQDGDTLSTEEILAGLNKIPNNKVWAPDDIPAELYKHSPVCKLLICEILQEIWYSEQVPDNFACATFVMFYKHKGSSNDPTRYRCIGLFNHMYKVLSQCILTPLVHVHVRSMVMI